MHENVTYKYSSMHSIQVNEIRSRRNFLDNLASFMNMDEHEQTLVLKLGRTVLLMWVFKSPACNRRL